MLRHRLPRALKLLWFSTEHILKPLGMSSSGWAFDDVDLSRHTGGDPGIATYMFFDPSTTTGRILIINTSVRNSGGVEQFYSIWNKLGEYLLY